MSQVREESCFYPKRESLRLEIVLDNITLRQYQPEKANTPQKLFRIFLFSTFPPDFSAGVECLQ